jgi:hypothetical protein
MYGRSLHGNRDISRSAACTSTGPHREGAEPTPMMNDREKSDPSKVAKKLVNKAERSAAEPVEPRAGTKGNANQQHSGRTQSRETVSQVLARIRQTASSDLPSLTRGRSPMRESRTYGSVRGAGSNLRPYRDRQQHPPGTADPFREG